MIDFSGYSREAIQKAMIAHVPRTIDTREGSIIQIALSPAAWYLEGIYMLLGQMQDNVYADTAVGECLDYICSAHDLNRKAATAAVREGRFNAEVPPGSAFRTISGADSLVFYVGDFLSAKDGMYTYEMICGAVGIVGNAYSGKIIPVTSISGLVSAEIGAIISPGTDEETDDALRKRLLAKIRLPSTSGNKYDYYNWAMECEGVGAAKVFPLADGPGTVKVIIANADMLPAPAELIKAAADHIEELRPVGANVTVASARERVINVSAKVRLVDGVNLGNVQSAFVAALIEYFHSNAFALSYVSVARIGSILLSTFGIVDYDQLQLNGIEDNVKLEQEEIAVAGAVSLEVM